MPGAAAAGYNWRLVPSLVPSLVHRLVPRLVHLLALVLVFAMSGAPRWLAELAKDDCADEGDDCTNEPSGCPDEGCGDCSILCSSCPRAHVVMPSLVPRIAPAELASWGIAAEAGQRVPTGPPPKDVFHPPRAAS